MSEDHEVANEEELEQFFPAVTHTSALHFLFDPFRGINRVRHESPQGIMFRGWRVEWHASHRIIDARAVARAAPRDCAAATRG